MLLRSSGRRHPSSQQRVRGAAGKRGVTPRRTSASDTTLPGPKGGWKFRRSRSLRRRRDCCATAPAPSVAAAPCEDPPQGFFVHDQQHVLIVKAAVRHGSCHLRQVRARPSGQWTTAFTPVDSMAMDGIDQVDEGITDIAVVGSHRAQHPHDLYHIPGRRRLRDARRSSDASPPPRGLSSSTSPPPPARTRPARRRTR